MRSFVLADKGTKDGLEWLEALPRDKDETSKEFAWGSALGPADDGARRQLRADDAPRFKSLERNPRLDPSLFRFSPPRVPTSSASQLTLHPGCE